MDFPVEATVNMKHFQDEIKVREILRSYGFEMRDLSRNMVRVQGSFLKLKAVKSQLEQLLNAQTQTSVYSSSHHPVSSGAIPKNYYSSSSSSSVSHGNTSRLESNNKAPHASPSLPSTSSFQFSDDPLYNPASSQYRTSFSPRPDQHDSVRSGSESFVVEGEVFTYAKRLKHKDIDNILVNNNVTMDEKEVGESCSITLRGKNARMAAGKLQIFLNSLTTMLRTQEVLHKDMDYNGWNLLQKIHKNRNIYNSVLVCEMNDRLHLVGPSLESFELKQCLLGRWVDRSGRTFDRNSGRRSSSLPPVGRKKTERDSGAIAKASPVTAAGYSPSKYQDDKQERAQPERGALRRRTLSESHENKQVERANGHLQEMENKRCPPTSKKGPSQLLPFDARNIKHKFKNVKKK